MRSHRMKAATFKSPKKAEFGYVVGGINSSFTVLATADRITFSTGTTAAFTSANLTDARYALPALSDKSAYGYFLGGRNPSFGFASNSYRITFSTGTTAAFTAANLSQARDLTSGLSDGSTYGYVIGGFNGSALTTADRITFSTGTTAAFTAANFSVGTYEAVGISDGLTYGYYAGGINSSSAQTNVAYRITFSTGTTSTHTPANLSMTVRQGTGLSDGSTYGYFAGGFTGASVGVNTTNRITFSTGTTSVYTASNLSQTRNGIAASSDGSVYGYFLGGSYLVVADRITFSTGTTAAFTSANLTEGKYYPVGLADYAI